MFGSDFAVVVRVAIADYMHEGRFSFCLVISLAAVLTPLLVLFGLKYGIISTMTQELVGDPRSRELRPLTQRQFGADWFEEMQKRPDVGFLMPQTRFLSATIRLRNKAEDTTEPVRAELTPSAPGDPLLADVVAQPDGFESIILSTPAAEALRAKAGDRIEGQISRITRDSDYEVVRLDLTVAAILPPASSSRLEAFVSLPFLVAAEDYREGLAVPRLQAEGRPPPEGERHFASFRLYASSIEDVAGLRDHLADANVRTDTRLAEIQLLQRLDYRLTVLFLIIVVLASVGYALSLTVSLWSSTDRKRRELSVLRLIGLKTVPLACVPGIQAILTAVLGSVVATVLYLLTEQFINALFHDALQAQQVLSRLEVAHFALAAAITIALSLLASIAASVRVAALSPSEGLRDE